jgi:hypothetical protein
MLVGEHRARPSTVFEDLDHLLEEFVARVQLLVFFVVRIVAVLADQDHAINGEFPRS